MPTQQHFVVPPALREDPSWIIWVRRVRETSDGTKVTKVPYCPWNPGGRDDPTNPENWVPYEDTLEWVDVLTNAGQGFVFHYDNPFVGIDLDGCRDPESGEVEDWAQDIVNRLHSFTEVSPSGTGLHIIIKGWLPKAVTPQEDAEEEVEVYGFERFFTVTGDHVPGTPKRVYPRQEVLADIVDEHTTVQEPIDPGTPDFEGEARDSDSPFYDLTPLDVYPHLTPGRNTSHPEHASSTGQNFRIHQDGDTAVCWHAGHQYGATQGCALNAQHLLAIQATGLPCDEVRRRWKHDDELVWEAWKLAVTSYGLDPDPPPWRAVRYKAREIDRVENLMDGGKKAWSAYRRTVRRIRSQLDVNINLDDNLHRGGANPNAVRTGNPQELKGADGTTIRPTPTGFEEIDEEESK